MPASVRCTPSTRMSFTTKGWIARAGSEAVSSAGDGEAQEAEAGDFSRDQPVRSRLMSL